MRMDGKFGSVIEVVSEKNQWIYGYSVEIWL